MSEAYRILCPKCTTDLTTIIGEMVEPVVKKLVRFFLSTPNIQRVGVKNIKVKTTCPSCGIQTEFDVNLNRLTEISLESMR